MVLPGVLESRRGLYILDNDREDARVATSQLSESLSPSRSYWQALWEEVSS